MQKNEKDVVAPGTYSNGVTGTSFSAPLVTGIVALLCEYCPSLKTQPHAVKAILAATSTATGHRYATDDSNFTIYGAGIVNAYDAIYSLRSDANMWTTGALQVMGSSQTYTMSVTPSDAYVRVALAYENKIMYSSSSNHTSVNTPYAEIGDLDLEIYAPNGNLVAYVHSSDLSRQANLKIVEFTPNGVYGNYTVKVVVTGMDSNKSAIEYAIAWR